MATTSTNRTPLFLMASHPTMSTVYEETKSATSKTRGRKPSKGPTQKKQRQRGVGVAQLERLRIEERWNKMTEFPSLPDPQPPLQCQTPFMSPFTEHHVSGFVPVQYPAPAPPSSVVNGSCGAGNGGAGFGGTFGMLMSDQVVLNPYAGIGVPDSRFFVETSRELSSMPKLQSVPHNCELCLKLQKKRFNGGNIGFDGGRDQNSEISPISGSGFHGSNLENIPNFTSNFGATAPRHATRNLDQGVEVVAIHRKGNSMGGSVFMEYEFFPGKSGRCTSSKGLELPREASVAVGGEPSYPTTTAYSATTSSVDLSLKLSY